MPDYNQDPTFVGTSTTIVGTIPVVGTWTPTDASGAGLVFTSITSGYVQLGNLVIAYAQFNYPATASGANAILGGLPVNSSATSFNPPSIVGGSSGNLRLEKGVNNALATFLNNTTAANVTNATLSGQTIRVMVIYPTV